MKRKLSIAIVTIVAIAFTLLAVNTIRATEHKLQLREVQLQERGAELKKLELKYRNLNTELDKTDKTNKDKIKQLEQEKKELDAERQRLERELQAKLQRKEQERLAQLERQENLISVVTQTETASAQAQPTHSVSGNKESWLRASGIPEHEWSYVDSIVSRESGWQPCAYYPSQNNCNATPSTACGLAQSLPCGKQSKYGHWTDPVANLKWQYEYVKGRYGGYAQAVAFWNANHWY